MEGNHMNTGIIIGPDKEERMETNRLLLNTTLRGGAWLMCAGAALGAGYGVFVAFGMFALHPGSGPISLGALSLFALVAAVIGGLIGATLGLVAGVLDGVVPGGIKRPWFAPLTHRPGDVPGIRGRSPVL